MPPPRLRCSLLFLAATVGTARSIIGRPALLRLRGGTDATMLCQLTANPFKGFQTCMPLPTPPAPASKPLIGVALACLASATNAASLNLQRWSAQRELRALNVVGILMGMACGLIDMASFSFAPQSVLAPFGSLALIINLLLAAPLHGDTITRADVCSTALVFCGVATCLANANTNAVARTYSEIVSLTMRTQWHLWLGFLSSGLGLAAAKLIRAPAGARDAALCYPILAGGLGSGTTLLGKALGELSKGRAPWYATALVGSLLPCFAIPQTVLLNKGVSRHSSLVVVPVFVATFVTCNAVGGGIFWDEFGGLRAAQLLLYPLGLAMLVAGVLILAAKPPPIVETPKVKGA